MLKEFLGQPAHPAYVHFPIAFFIFSSLFLALHRFDGQSQRVNRLLKKIQLGTFNFESFSLLCLLTGFLGGLLAIFSGLALVGGWKEIPIPHAPLGIGSELCYFVALVIRWVFGPSLYAKPVKRLYYALHILGVLLVGITGFEGGELHYG